MESAKRDEDRAKREEKKFVENLLNFGYRVCTATSTLGVCACIVSFTNDRMITGILYAVASLMLIFPTLYMRKKLMQSRNSSRTG